MPAETPAPRASAIATLFPGYFALVMATGIIAIGASLEEIDWLAQGLYAVAAVAYVVIAVLVTLRLVRYPRLLVADLTSHARGFAFITAVAATNVLGSASAMGLYLVVMTMVFLRWTFEPLDPHEFDSPAWIAAGAVAITVLAGSNLLLAQDASPRLARLAPAVELLVMLAWATATFWFPLMIAIGVWRHIVNRMPLRYHPSYWALVFPIGMYGVASARLIDAVDLTALDWLPPTVLMIALAAWALTLTGLIVATATRR